MKIKNNSQRLFFFFEFFNPLKQNKDKIFKPKNSLKLVAKILKMGKFALKILDQNNPKGWVFIT